MGRWATHLRRRYGDVRVRPLLFVGVVTQLDTHPLRVTARQLSSPGAGITLPVSQPPQRSTGPLESPRLTIGLLGPHGYPVATSAVETR